MDLWFGHWPSDCAVTIAEEHFISNFGSILLFLFKKINLCVLLLTFGIFHTLKELPGFSRSYQLAKLQTAQWQVHKHIAGNFALYRGKSI